MKTDSKKATYPMAGRKTGKHLETLTAPEISIPPHFHFDSGMSKGFWRLNRIHLRELSIKRKERIKTVC